MAAALWRRRRGQREGGAGWTSDCRKWKEYEDVGHVAQVLASSPNEAEAGRARRKVSDHVTGTQKRKREGCAALETGEVGQNEKVVGEEADDEPDEWDAMGV